MLKRLALATSFVLASTAFAKEADESNLFGGTLYSTPCCDGHIPPAKPFNKAMAEYGLNPNHFPRLRANWGAVGNLVISVIAARYLEKGLDKLEDVALEHINKVSKSLNAAQSKGERDIMVEVYKRTGEWDYVGDPEIDNTANVPQY